MRHSSKAPMSKRHAPGLSGREAGELLGIPPRTVNYWAETALVCPSIQWMPFGGAGACVPFRGQGAAYCPDWGNAILLYCLRDLVALRVCRDLSERKVDRGLIRWASLIAGRENWRRRAFAFGSVEHQPLWLGARSVQSCRQLEPNELERLSAEIGIRPEHIVNMGACYLLLESDVPGENALDARDTYYPIDERAAEVAKLLDEWVDAIPEYLQPNPVPGWL